MTPFDYCYSITTGDPKRELRVWGFTPLEKVYGYDPIPKELKGSERNTSLAHNLVCGRNIRTPRILEYMLFPRLLAFSEVLVTIAAMTTMIFGDGWLIIRSPGEAGCTLPYSEPMD